MKPTALRCALASAVLSAPLAAQTLYVWDGEAGDSVLGAANNWNPNATPTSGTGAGSSDTARWDGSVLGNLSLPNSGTFGGGTNTAGINLDFTATQTGSVSIAGGIIRTNGIAIAGGAGAVSLPTVQIGGRSATTSHTISNNSANGLVIGSLTRGGNSQRDVAFSGSGNITISGQIDPGAATNAFNIAKSGDGTLFLDGGLHANNNSTLSISGGAVRISNAGALGNAGSGSAGVTNINTNGNGRLELTGGITVNERIFIRGRNSTDATQSGVQLLNVSGNNSLTGDLVWDSGGPIYRVRSDAGKLTITGNVAPVGGTKTLLVNGPMHVGGSDSGSGDVEFSGNLSDAASGTLSVTKEGGGTLILSGTNTYTGTTTVNGGTLEIGSGGSISNSSAIALAGGNFNVSSVPGFTVAAGQTLIGNGSVTGDLLLAGTLGIGSSPGTMTFNDDLTLAAGSLSIFDLTAASLATGTFDLARGGDGIQTVTFGGTLNLLFDSGESYLAGSSVKIFDFENYLGAFSTVNVSGLGEGLLAEFDPSSGIVSLSAVPEPGPVFYGALGTLAVVLRRRRATDAL